MEILQQISQSLQDGKANDVKALVEKAIEQGIAPDVILNDGLLSGMSVVGEKFKANEIFVPNVLVAARAMKFGTDVLKPLLKSGDSKSKGKVVLGTVKGDLHDIGKNLVRMMMEGKGLEVVDLGTDVSPEAFVETFQRENAQIIALSSLLTTTMNEMQSVVDKCKETGIRDNVMIMIGGAPITDDFCKQIGADSFTPDAASAAEVAAEYCAKAIG